MPLLQTIRPKVCIAECTYVYEGEGGGENGEGGRGKEWRGREWEGERKEREREGEDGGNEGLVN